VRERWWAAQGSAGGAGTGETRGMENVLYELDGHVATITYNRPDALNAINGAMLP
jgi:hypothetical protein